MDDLTYQAYLERARQATSVRALRALADEVLAHHPDDPRAQLLDATCFQYAISALATVPARRGGQLPLSDAGGILHAMI